MISVQVGRDEQEALRVTVACGISALAQSRGTGADVAERAGHDVDVLLRFYANKRIAEVLTA
ncbi:hypothetical protein ACOZ38_36265 [Sphaerisporangium viridialbum]|uniref:hypothetical protein n=1 Tax=Sphaerisporangium viridialbum TaxID=46189 RepID=UPI003C791EDB